jgi:hypothetical protein
VALRRGESVSVVTVGTGPAQTGDPTHARHHDTVLYVDKSSRRFRHAPLGIAVLNLVLEVVGSRGRLILRGDSPSKTHQVSFAQSTGEIRAQEGRADLEYDIETFADEIIGLRMGQKYVGADITGIVQNHLDWCREWKRFRLVRADTLDGLSLLRRHSWLSHRDRRIITLAAQPTNFGNDVRAESSALAATLAPGAISFRRELVFGPARVGFAGRNRSILAGQSGLGDRDLPGYVHIVDGSGTIHSFSRFAPLICYCVYGEESSFECLRLPLTSLAKCGYFHGAVGVACDRPRDKLVKYIPEVFHHRLIISEASVDRGQFNRYYFDQGLYEAYQLIVFCDVDVVFDTSTTDLLIDVLLSDQTCCTTEDGKLSDLADRPPGSWDKEIAHEFGRDLSPPTRHS